MILPDSRRGFKRIRACVYIRGDAVCLVVEDEREKIVSSLAAAVAAFVDEDAELLGQWQLLMEWIKNSRGPPVLGGS